MKIKNFILRQLISFLIAVFLASGALAIVNGDFEGGSLYGWTVRSGTVNISYAKNHTPGGMFSCYLWGTLTIPAEVYQVEGAANVGETWKVDGWIWRGAGGICQFGWGDGPMKSVTLTGDWVFVSDTITFTSGDTKEVVCYRSGAGEAYLDDVVTEKIIISVDTTPPTWSTTTGCVSATTTEVPGAVYLTWGTATDDQSPPVTYNIYYDTFSPPTTKRISSLTVTSYTIYGLKSGLTYYFIVRAQDSVGNEDNNLVVKSVVMPTAVERNFWELYN